MFSLVSVSCLGSRGAGVAGGLIAWGLVTDEDFVVFVDAAAAGCGSAGKEFEHSHGGGGIGGGGWVMCIWYREFFWLVDGVTGLDVVVRGKEEYNCRKRQNIEKDVSSARRQRKAL